MAIISLEYDNSLIEQKMIENNGKKEKSEAKKVKADNTQRKSAKKHDGTENVNTLFNILNDFL